ncbi:MAG: hypothetical protein ACK45E_06265 [Ignavibacteria bacterium]
MRSFIALWITSAVLVAGSSAQTPMGADIDTVFRIRATAFVGAMATLYDRPPTTQSTTTTYLGNTLGGRLVWHPNHLLAVGVQSGFVFFSTDDLIIDGVESGRAGLAAVPLHLILTITYRSFEFGMGLGMYQLQSLWRIQGIQRAASSDYEYGVNPWIGYEFSLSDRFSIGPEVGAHILSNRGMKAFQVGVKVTADVVRY